MSSPKLTPRKKERFIQRLTETGNVTAAADFADIPRMYCYDMRKAQPEFAAQWDDALLAYANKLEAEADRRAYEGVDQPVYQGGELVGTKRVYSDTLLIFRLKALRPEVYRERQDVRHQVDADEALQKIAVLLGVKP